MTHPGRLILFGLVGLLLFTAHTDAQFVLGGVPTVASSFAPSIVRSVNLQHNAGATDYTWTIPAVGVGNTLVGMVRSETNSSLPASLDRITLGSQNVFLLQRAENGRFVGDTLGVQLWWMPNVQGSPTTVHFITDQSQAFYLEDAVMAEFVGVPSTAAIDASAATAFANNTTSGIPNGILSSPTITPANSGDLLYGPAMLYDGSPSPWSAGSGWTQATNLVPGTFSLLDEWRVYHSTAPIAATVNAQTAQTWDAFLGVIAISPSTALPQITHVQVPNYFAAPGYTGAISVSCSAACPGTPTYSLSTTGACSVVLTFGSNNNTLFTISGTQLNAASSSLAANNYLIGIAVNMSNVSNSGICFPINLYTTTI